MIRVFAIFVIAIGFGFMIWPLQAVRVLGWRAEVNAIERHRWSLRIIGLAAIACGVGLIVE